MKQVVLLILFLLPCHFAYAVKTVVSSPPAEEIVRPSAKPKFGERFLRKLAKRFPRAKSKADRFEVNRNLPLLTFFLGLLTFPVLVIGINLFFELGVTPAGFSVMNLAIGMAALTVFLAVRVIKNAPLYEIPGGAIALAILAMVFAVPITILGLIAVLVELRFL